MINEIYEKNVNAFITYAKNKEIIVASIKEADDTNVYLEEGILALEKENRIWYFNSRYNSSECVEVFSEQYKDVRSAAVITVFGFGTGEYIRGLLKATKAEKIIVYEPNEAVFKKIIENNDITDLLANERVYVAVGKSSVALYQEYLGLFLVYTNINLSVFISLPNYERVYNKEYEFIASIYNTEYGRVLMNKNTNIRFGQAFIQNSLKTIPDAIKQYSLYQLTEKFENVKDEEKTAVLVSAGPSLDKNVALLKEVKGKHLIMVVDTALKAVLRQGVEPDITITVDSEKNEKFFEHEGFVNVPMIVSVHSNSHLFETHKAKRFYYLADEDYLKSMYDRLHRKNMFLDTGGSVANNAFSALVQMGYKNIILIGQDLAYPNGQGHTKEAFDGKEGALRADKKYFYVKDIYGNDVLTETNMNHYRKWFESEIRKRPELNVIDATEGGAFIEGTKIMTLRKAIDNISGTSINAREIIEEIEPVFSKEQQEALLKEIKEVPEYLAKTEDQLNDGIKKYKRLEQLAAKGKFSGSEYRRLVEDIGKLNVWVDNDPILKLACTYNAKTDYEVQSQVYDYDENASQYTQIREITEFGIKSLEAYIDGAKKLQTDWSQALINMSEMS